MGTRPLRFSEACPKFQPMLIRILFALLALAAGPAHAQGREIPASPQDIQLSFSPIVKKVAPAVVNIYTKRTVVQRVNPFMNDPFFSQLFQGGRFGGQLKEQMQSALGSGVIVQADGLVVTNAHVSKNAQEIKVVLADGREFDAELVLLDEPSDLALLRMETGGQELPHVSLKSSETLEVGDIVLAIGNPFGVGQTVTSGIVSAQGRSSLNINDFNFFIQTDAAINPGNSGGPLVAMDGGVVGINTAIYSQGGGSLGIGFAIPSEMVMSVIAAEKSGGTAAGITRPWLGVTAQKVTADIAASLNISPPQGALISKLHAASPLAKAGMKVGDVVLSVNGKTIRDPSEMKFRMATVKLGDKAVMEALRQGEKKTYDVLAMAPPDKPAREETLIKGQNPLSGLTIANLNPAVAVELDIFGDEEEGVVVTKGGQGGFFNIARSGDILTEINGVPVHTVKEVLAALRKPADARGWVIGVRSKGQTRQISIR